MAGKYTVKVSKLGDVKIEAEGFTGTSCKDATEAMEMALAGKDSNTDYKPEYYESASEGEEEHLRF